MRRHHIFMALFLVAAISAGTAGQDKNADVKPVQEAAPSTPAVTADPMASFARMVSGEWQMTAQSGTSMFDTWHWGPGQQSMRAMTDGFGADGKPWRELQVFYWHPGRKQICLLGVSPYARGVSEGTITFEGESADAVLDLHQAGASPVHRKMGLRWTFDGADKYHETLLEATGPEGLKPMNEWNHVRSSTHRPKTPRRAEETPKPSGRLKALEPLLSRIWEARGQWASGDAFHTETTFEWVPLADAIYARTFALRGNGSPMHVLDAYFYHHTGTDRLRCLALSNWRDEGGGAGVYEGDVTVLEGEGALQLDLKGYEGERVVPYVVRFDFEKDGTLHHRVWSLEDAAPERTSLLDVRHAASQMSKSILVVFQDKKKNYWFGSDVHGVYRYDGKDLAHFTTADGLCDDRVRGIQEDKSGNIYLTTSNGISKFDGRAFSTLVPVKSIQPGEGWRLSPDDLWFPFGQNSGAVCRYDGVTLHCLEFPRTKLGDEHYAAFPRSKYPRMRSSPYDVYSIFKDSKGNVWFGTGTGTGMLGACRYDGKSFTWISSDELEFGDLGYCVRSIVEDKDGKFWFSNTLNRFDAYPNDPASQGSFKKGAGIGGLKGHSRDELAYFMSSTLDDAGALWMATFGSGVWRYDGKALTHYPVMDGSVPVTMFSIYKDNNGVLWLGTHEAGAYTFNGKTFEKFRP